MTYREYFPPYASKIDKFLARFFRSKIDKSAKITPVAAEMWQKLEDFITGGKRIRGGLVKLGYECFKRPDKDKLLPTSAAVEITHGSILVHDDIIDRGELRHGRPTVHRRYEDFHKKHYKKGDPLHYGESMAIMVGDIGVYAAIDLISKGSFPEKVKHKVIQELIDFMIKTIYGENLDVDLAYREKIKEKDIATINTLKTAYYTIVGPLKMGGILAEASNWRLKRFEDYGIPIGVAFQLQDDILGMFGSVEKLGKPVDSDIKEGKNTLLYTQALKRGTAAQRKRLTSLWGKKDITPGEVEEARKIIKDTGSLEHSQKLARRLVEKGKKTVPKITKNKELQEVFLSLADFIVKREK